MQASEYFAKLFPYGLLKLLMEPPIDYRDRERKPRCGRREIAFGFPKTEPGSNNVHNVFQRYQTFPSTGNQSTEQLLKQRFSRLPLNTRIDLGGVMTTDVADARRSDLSVGFRELIFDVDLDKEYNCFRTCECVKEEKSPPFICPQCWPYLTLAIRTVEHLLARHFGWYDTLWLFSGRRGVHCWVLDPAAGLLSDQSRRHITEFFRRFTYVDSNPAQWLAYQPSLQELYTQILKPRLRLMIERQQIRLSDKQTLNVIANSFATVPDSEQLFAILRALETGDLEQQADLWDQLVALSRGPQFESALINVTFFLTFPRLDYNVMPARNHLLRCPLSVHADTQSVVSPLDLDHLDDIDPQFLPNLRMEHTLLHFDRFVHLLQLALFCRLPVADHLVCQFCAESCTYPTDLPKTALFVYDKAALITHCQNEHQRTVLSMDGFTLRDWVNRTTLREDNKMPDRSKKYDFYRLLRDRFSC